MVGAGDVFDDVVDDDHGQTNRGKNQTVHCCGHGSQLTCGFLPVR